MLLKDTKVYAVLEKFDKYEQNRCRKYIQSPYFNSDENIVDLYNLLIKDINKKPKKALQKRMVWKILFPKKAYNDARFRKYVSDLLRLTEGYLAQKFYENNPVTASYGLIKAVERKKLKILYKSAIKNARFLSKKYINLSADYFYQQYKIEDYYFEVAEFEANIKQKFNYEEIMYNLDQFYLVEKLRLYCGILSWKRISTFDYDVSFIDEVINFVKDNFDKVAPNVEIYYRIHLTYAETDNEENYNILKKLLNLHSLSFPQEEAYHLYLQLINYCTKKIRQGHSAFYNEIFSLYKNMIDNNLIYEEDMIAPATFRNIITVSTRLKEFKWAEDFIHQNKNCLPTSQRENLVTFNLARLYFAQKKYDKVIELLREVEYSDITLSLQSKSFLLMTYYDIDEYEPLEFLLESFRVYLNRHKEIPKHRVDYHKNLIKFTKKLTKIIPGDKTAVAKIKQEIETTEGFRVKWLEEKIAELE
ncbi:MAG: hypothetical protein AAF806_23065 [Bacteroidota bacterium]